MKLQKQTKFGEGTGMCFTACIASLLGVDIEEVPFFAGEDDWKKAVNDWLAPRGYAYTEYSWKHTRWTKHGEFVAVCCGPNPDGIGHAVLMRIYNNAEGAHCAQKFFDPNPSNNYITEIEFVGLLIPTWMEAE